MKRRLLIAGLLGLAARPALAEGAEKAAVPAGRYIDISPVAIPILADGRLVNYVFVAIRVHLAPTADAAKWRAKEPYFRDALARIGNRNSFADPKDYASVDGPRLAAAFRREAVAIAGNDVKSISILSQTPKQRTGLPRRRPGVAPPAA